MRYTLVVIVLLCACTSPQSAGINPDTPQTPYQRDLAPKLSLCIGCHGGDAPKAGLDLADIKSSVGSPSSQIGMALIEPGNHLQSYLWHKVAGTQSIAGGLGQRMPPIQQWSEEDVALLARWIDLGAPD